MPERITVGKNSYPIIGYVETENGKIPLLDIPMISDEEWNQKAKEECHELL